MRTIGDRLHRRGRRGWPRRSRWPTRSCSAGIEQLADRDRDEVGGRIEIDARAAGTSSRGRGRRRARAPCRRRGTSRRRRPGRCRRRGRDACPARSRRLTASTSGWVRPALAYSARTLLGLVEAAGIAEHADIGLDDPGDLGIGFVGAGGERRSLRRGGRRRRHQGACGRRGTPRGRRGRARR